MTVSDEAMYWAGPWTPVMFRWLEQNETDEWAYDLEFLALGGGYPGFGFDDGGRFWRNHYFEWEDGDWFPNYWPPETMRAIRSERAMRGK